MHLLAAQPGTIQDGSEAVDLGQSTADVIFITAADTEIALLARAFDEERFGFSLRLANMMALSHPMSVDLYVAKTLRKAKLVVARVLGGAAYWPYGLDEIESHCRENGIPFAFLPGDAKADHELAARSAVSAEAYAQLHAYLNEGSSDNASLFHQALSSILKSEELPPPARPLVKAGAYYPDFATPTLSEIQSEWKEGAPLAAIIFYRALMQSGNTEPIDALVRELRNQGVNALPFFVPSLKDGLAKAVLAEQFSAHAPDVILNTTGFAVSSADGDEVQNPLAIPGVPILQVVLSGATEEAWQADIQGLSARDLAMHVVLPELDGRVLARAVSFKSAGTWDEATETNIVAYQSLPDRIAFTAELAKRWTRLSHLKNGEKKVAIILANYPNQDGRIGNGVGYDTPQSSVEILNALAAAGYNVEDIPENGTSLVHELLDGPTNAADTERLSDVQLSAKDYESAFRSLPAAVQKAVESRWGKPTADPFFKDGDFHLAIRKYGNVMVGVQPARGYNIDPKETYHDPDLVPPHGYFAFYVWLKQHFGADAFIHNGKHGNLEWLPGKAIALTEICFPEAVFGPMPNLYPFIVNDPGEGTQAKRRTSAVIIDHLTPPLTRAETYGPLKDLEALVDEYYLAAGLDARRLAVLRKHILELVRDEKLDLDAGISEADSEDDALNKLDAYLCDLKEAQIRDGLHILGRSPEGVQERDLLVALARSPRKLGEEGDQSLIRALAADFGFDFDPLDCDFAAKWNGAKPDALLNVTDELWRTHGDTVERLELYAQSLIEGASAEELPQTAKVLAEIETSIRPKLKASGVNEMNNLLSGLSGKFVPPGASGAPTRGRLDVLPTGRNFYSIDNRTLPTPAAWNLGKKSADLLVQHYFQENGRWPKAMGLTAWGTSNMRTGGDDIAQALALIGAKPKWDTSSWRVVGFDIIPLAELARPRVDVTLRISGFFRDAFPAQIALFDSAVQAIAALEEEAADNPFVGQSDTLRVFGSKPGAYGAGLQALIDEKIWDTRADLADAYVEWGGYAYGAKIKGEAAHSAFETRLGNIEAVVQNQDNREHDLLDSDDYYQFEGGMSAAVEKHAGKVPATYHNDHSRPDRPVIRTLDEEIGRVMRSRVVNPKWIDGVKRHGYKGAFEIAATVDYMFAFSATTGAVKDHHFDMAYAAFLEDSETREFIATNNAPALREISARFLEAIDRQLWTPKSNSAYDHLTHLKEGRSS